jgi:parallel beta-helix repeat protein
MEFRGEPGAVLSGAIVLEGAEELGDGRWRITGVERTGRDHGTCIDDAVACGYTQDVFIDDVMLWQVSSQDLLESGAWFWSDDGIYLADDPAGRRVELSVEDYAFRSAADDVVIEDLVIEKYATMAQEGAVQAQESGNGERGVGWRIESIDVSGVHGAGIRTGDATVVRNVRSHHNGQMGISVSGGTDVLLEGNEFDHNNVAGFAWGWEAGGSKFTRTTNLVVRDNHAHHNNGPGLWTDIANVDTLYEDNLAESNTGPGIFHEISYEAIIRNNVVTGNGSDNDGWLWGAGIVIAASEGVQVIGNEVRGNANAIAGVQQDRGDGPRGPYLLDRLKVTDNVVEIGTGMTGVVEDVGDPSVFDRELVFEGNVYVGPVGESYAWMGRKLDRRGWQSFGQDVNGTWR